MTPIYFLLQAICFSEISVISVSCKAVITDQYNTHTKYVYVYNRNGIKLTELIDIISSLNHHLNFDSRTVYSRRDEAVNVELASCLTKNHSKKMYWQVKV